MSILSRICKRFANWSSVPACRKSLAAVRLRVEQFEERSVPAVLSATGSMLATAGVVQLSSLNHQQQNGLAPNYMVGLANELNSGAWLKMPHTAGDDYVRQFCQSTVPVTASSNILVAEPVPAAKSLSTLSLTTAH